MEGEDPLARFSPTAAAHLLRTDGFTHVADIMVNSFYDEQLDEGCAFEELISLPRRHGRPADAAVPAASGGARGAGRPIIGAEAAFGVLAGWRRRLQGEATPSAAGGVAPDERAEAAGREAAAPQRRHAVLFMIGSFGFALGSMSFYASAVAPTLDAATFFVSSIFFTSASFLQLVQSQSPGDGCDGDGARRRTAARPLPRLAAARQGVAGRGDAVPRHPVLQRDDVLGHHRGARQQQVRPGGVAAGLLRLGAVPGREPVRDPLPGPAPELAAARGRLVGRLAEHGRVDRLHGVGDRSLRASRGRARRWTCRSPTAGTLVGAVCFFLGALLMLPAFRQAGEAARVSGAA